MDSDEDLIISNCIESTVGNLKDKIGDIKKKKSNAGSF